MTKKEYDKDYYQKNKNKKLAASKKRRHDNMVEIRLKSLEYYYKNRDILLEKEKNLWKENPEKIRFSQRKSNKKLFNDVLDHYGHQCYICTSTEDLCIDHIGGWDGKGSYLSGAILWIWLKRNNFPLGFRTLCRFHNILDGMIRRDKFLGFNGIDDLIKLKKFREETVKSI